MGTDRGDDRKLAQLKIPDSVWETYDLMSREMGADVGGLVNQALFFYARMSGYTVPGTHASAPLQVAGGGLAIAPAPDGLPTEPQVGKLRAGAPTPIQLSSPSAQAAAAAMPTMMPQPIQLTNALPASEMRSAQERVLAKAAELERLVGGGGPVAVARPADVLADRGMEEPEDSAATLAGDERMVVDDRLLGEDAAAMAAPEPAPAPRGSATSGVTILCDGRELGRVVKERYLIGRGKHCDLVIPSGKVSREHAAIVKASDGWYIEDLGSSNGTWYDKRRITRRKLVDGDEYYICSEKITVQLQ
jgi:hypothetical protein